MKGGKVFENLAHTAKRSSNQGNPAEDSARQNTMKP